MKSTKTAKYAANLINFLLLRSFIYYCLLISVFLLDWSISTVMWCGIYLLLQLNRQTHVLKFTHKGARAYNRHLTFYVLVEGHERVCSVIWYPGKINPPLISDLCCDLQTLLITCLGVRSDASLSTCSMRITLWLVCTYKVLSINYILFVLY